jgi:hypothetical protein
VLKNTTMDENINLNIRILKTLTQKKSDMRIGAKTEEEQQGLANSLCTCDAFSSLYVERQPMKSEEMESKTTWGTSEPRTLPHKGKEGRYDCSC